MGAAGGAVVVDGVGDHGYGGGGWGEGGGYDVRVGKLGGEDHRETRILWSFEKDERKMVCGWLWGYFVSSE